MKPKIVFLDEYSLAGRDLSAVKALGDYTGYDMTAPDEVAVRCADAEIVVTNKVRLDAAMIAQLPHLRLICVAATGVNNIDLDAAPYDYAVDAIDTLSPKLALIKGCLDRGIPLVSSMGAGAKTDPTRMEIADIGRTHHCPLAHMLRKRLHKLGIRTGFRAVFSAEPAREGAMILCEEQNKKSNVGTISYLPALFGIGCASVVVRDLLGEMEDSGKRESND